MKIRFGIPVVAALLTLPAVWAQSNAAPAKVGVISVSAAIQSTSEGKQAAAELQSQFAPRQTELDNLRKQIEDLQTRLRTTSNTLSDEEKARLSREGDQLTRTYQRKQQDSQDDYTEAEREIVDRIGRKMIDVLDKYSTDNGYVVILDTSAQNTPVIFAAKTTDVTQDIIRLYDQSYPVKNAATTRPAAPRSTTPKPAPQQPAQQQPAPH
jgi:Skp family chaperone for outer membrane proteins